MEKDKLISITNKMCEELLMIIEDDNVTKEQIADYLNESAQIVLNADSEDMKDLDFAQLMFHNTYKEIAKKSLSSYKNTNTKIKKLTEIHETTLKECNSQHIDVLSIADKFQEIQSHMTDEVIKANEIITKLTDQVKTLEEKSNIDSLTKVFNRRAMTSYIDKICSNSSKSYNFYVLMLDIDDFKQINDHYGHIAGDKVLIFIANILKKTLRDGDKIFRYGGEEFIIILNRIDTKYCEKISNRLLKLVRSNQLIYKGESLSVTISIGATKFLQGDTPDSLIARADKALYKAKKNGKDQIYMEVI
jgi:diguanylate cyclase (GGDEF)-like protein